MEINQGTIVEELATDFAAKLSEAKQSPAAAVFLPLELILSAEAHLAESEPPLGCLVVTRLAGLAAINLSLVLSPITFAAHLAAKTLDHYKD